MEEPSIAGLSSGHVRLGARAYKMRFASEAQTSSN